MLYQASSSMSVSAGLSTCSSDLALCDAPCDALPKALAWGWKTFANDNVRWERAFGVCTDGGRPGPARLLSVAAGESFRFFDSTKVQPRSSSTLIVASEHCGNRVGAVYLACILLTLAARRTLHSWFQAGCFFPQLAHFSCDCVTQSLVLCFLPGLI